MDLPEERNSSSISMFKREPFLNEQFVIAHIANGVNCDAIKQCIFSNEKNIVGPPVCAWQAKAEISANLSKVSAQASW